MTLDTGTMQRRAGCNVRPRTPSGTGLVSVSIMRSGILAEAFCRDVVQAEIAAVFERSFYLRSGGMFICVGAPAIGNGPLTLIAEFGSRHLAALGLCPGRLVPISDRGITIDGKARFTFEHCEPWRPARWPRSRPPHALADVARAITRRIAVEAPAQGFARLACMPGGESETPLARIARPRLARFASWLRAALENDPAAASPEPVAGLIGLGPGLTPSGDDFLVGTLALLDALAESDAREALARAIAVSPRGATSALSHCLLRAAAAGHVGETLCGAVAAVVAGTPDPAVAAIRNIGHSSGWDMMAGILTALEIVAAARTPRA